MTSNAPQKKWVSNPLDLLSQLEEERFQELPNCIKDQIELGYELDDLNSGDFEENIQYFIYQFQRDQYAYVRRGMVAYKFKYYKVHKRLGYKTHKNFCQKVFGVSHWRIDAEIRAAKTFLTLVIAGFDIFPKNSAQAEMLRGFGTEDLIENWQHVIDNMAPHDISAPSIRQLLYAPTDDDRAMKNVKLPAIDYEKVWNEARERCCSTPQFIAHCVDFTIANETESTKSKANRSLHFTGGFFLANIFSALLHHFETLLYSLNPALKEAIWEDDLADLTSNYNGC